MMKPVLPLLMLLLMLYACSASRRTAGNSASTAMMNIPAPTPKLTDDGLSFATAIVITEKTETTGVQAEYDWIKQHYENYKVKGQSLSYHDKKPFDIITITLADVKDLALYFDISNYFGKF